MTKRNPGISLFKMFSMFMIALLHVVGMGGIVGNAIGTTYDVAYFIRCVTFCSVDCYALVTGYLYYQKKTRLSRILELWIEIFVYSVIITTLMIKYDPTLKKTENIISAVLPIISSQYWYMTSYFMLWLFIPALNAFAERASKSLYTATLIAVLALSSLTKLVGMDAFRISSGYSAFWLMVMYLVGAYIRKYNIMQKVNKYLSLLLFILISAGYYLVCRYFRDWLGEKLPERNINFLAYDFIFPVAMSVFLFIAFAKTKIGPRAAKIISIMDPASLGVYLIHTHPLLFVCIIYKIAIPLAECDPVNMTLGAVGIALLIYFTCMAIDLIRIQLFRLLRINKILRKLDEKIELVAERKEKDKLPGTVEVVEEKEKINV